MKSTSFDFTRAVFEDWISRHGKELKITEWEYTTPLADEAGIDVIWRRNGKVESVQMRSRRTSVYNDVTIRYKTKEGARDYKMNNVGVFLYITPKWWQLYDARFWNDMLEDDVKTNHDHEPTSFKAYRKDTICDYLLEEGPTDE